MSNEAYERHRAKQHEAAQKEYKKFMEKLTPEEKKRAIDMNVHEPPKDKYAVGGKCPSQEKDIADTPIARVNPEEIIDSPAEILADQFSIPLDKAEIIITWHESEKERESTLRENERTRAIVSGILMSNTPKLACAGIAFAVNLDNLNNINQTEFADEYDISRSHISKETLKWQRLLGLEKSVHQKSAAACQTYSKKASNSHWRRKLYKTR